jgi:trk system potassium uptake protein TrkH
LRWLLRWYFGLSPHAFLVASFLLLIAAGTAGLLLIPGLYTGAPLRPLDALFTMTSAVCVTGLTVVDTATAFTFWGQLWILIFIQLGGLGLISLGSIIIAALGARLSLRSEMIAIPTHTGGRSDVDALTRATARLVFGVEGVGAVVLWLAFLPHYDAGTALWHGIFHSVSAFCNAGFSTFSTSLMEHAGRPWILLPISFLIVLGGFGLLATEELLRWWRAGGRQAPRRLSTHTFAVVLTTAVLLGGGAVLYAVFEWNGTLREMSFLDRLCNAWFMSATARTAGFNSVSYALVGNHALFLTVMLMFIGGSPGSTAGGVKTTSLAVLVAMATARINGRRHVELHQRTVPDGTIERTVSLVLVSFLVVALGAFLLDVSETGGVPLAQARQTVLPIVFETVSAFGTVGLSMDYTPTLSPMGRLLSVFLMFIGRVGPIAFFAAVSVKARALPAHTRAAREDLIVG